MATGCFCEGASIQPAINARALTIYIETLRKIAPDASAEKIAIEAVRWHDICVARGWIVPDRTDGVGILSAA